MYIKTFVALTIIASVQVASAAIVSHTSDDLARAAGMAGVNGNEIITRCDAPADYSEGLQQAKLGMSGRQLISAETIMLTLVKQGDSYDVLVGPDSLGASGKFIHAGGEDPVHLILDSNSGVEHFLFDINLDGSGELLWSSASESALTTCVAGI